MNDKPININIEPLKGKRYIQCWEWLEKDKEGEWLKFPDVKGATEWFLRYRDFPQSFRHDEPKRAEEFVKHFCNECNCKHFSWKNPDEFDMSRYRDWLFKEAFYDIVQKSKKEGEKQ